MLLGICCRNRKKLMIFGTWIPKSNEKTFSLTPIDMLCLLDFKNKLVYIQTISLTKTRLESNWSLFVELGICWKWFKFFQTKNTYLQLQISWRLEKKRTFNDNKCWFSSSSVHSCSGDENRREWIANHQSDLHLSVFFIWDFLFIQTF